MEVTGDVWIRREGPIGRITLQRPKALNALSHAMANSIDEALKDWSADAAIKSVLIDAAGEKAFCAGGEIKDLYQQGLSGDFRSGQDFWRDEYRLNARLKNYTKPVISMMTGITMGGGVGLGCHCSSRIVSDDTLIALPECSIGLVPDVGSTLLLAHAPGYLGEFLALAGYRMNAQDAIHCGFADHYVPAAKLVELHTALQDGASAATISAFSNNDGPSELAQIEPAISPVFGADSLNEIVERLEGLNAAWSERAVKAIKRGFTAALMLKDLLLSQSAAAPVDTDTPMGARAAEIYEKFVGGYEKGQDFSTLLPAFLAGLR